MNLFDELYLINWYIFVIKEGKDASYFSIWYPELLARAGEAENWVMVHYLMNAEIWVINENDEEEFDKMAKLRLSYLTARFDRDALVAANEEETDRVYEIPAAVFYIDSDIDEKKCLELEEKAKKLDMEVRYF